MLPWILISAFLLGLDQLSKALVLANFTHEGDTIPIINNFFHFTFVRNPGAVFGIGGESGWALYAIVAAAFIAIGIFVALFIKSDFKNKKLWLYHLALSLLMAGTLGNFCDRVFQPQHMVIDFIDFRGIWNYIFNIADMCLTIGISMFLFDQIILEPKRVKPHESA
jgi:signal peptidase II